MSRGLSGSSHDVRASSYTEEERTIRAAAERLIGAMAPSNFASLDEAVSTLHAAHGREANLRDAYVLACQKADRGSRLHALLELRLSMVADAANGRRPDDIGQFFHEIRFTDSARPPPAADSKSRPGIFQFRDAVSNPPPAPKQPSMTLSFPAAAPPEPR